MHALPFLVSSQILWVPQKTEYELSDQKLQSKDDRYKTAS
jgi:hypothetical protein